MFLPVAAVPAVGFTHRGHVVRAMLEAICFQTREVLDAMRADADMSTMKALRVDGGAAKNNLLMQLQVGLWKSLVEHLLEMNCSFLRVWALGVVSCWEGWKKI